MAFTSLKLKSASGANRIKNADEAYSFMMHMRLSDQNKPHWQMARQALNNAAASDDLRNSGLGGRFGRRPPRKAGFWIRHKHHR